MAEVKKHNAGGARQGAGRPKGSPNKITLEVRQKFMSLVDSLTLDQLKEDLMSLEPEARLKILNGMLIRLLPAHVQLDNNVSGNVTFVTEIQGEAPEVED